MWAHVGIFVSRLIKLRPENLYLNSETVSFLFDVVGGWWLGMGDFGFVLGL